MPNKQSASTVLMIRPVDFSFNQETAVSNAFQNAAHGLDTTTIKQNAEKEFDGFVALLKSKGVEVIIFDDTELPATPDSIFPNNWISLDQHGRLALYPMQAMNRRQERRNDIVEFFKEHYSVVATADFTHHEGEDKFLEGTGSMVIDYVNNIVYACLSPRTHAEVIEAFCEKMGYTACTFTALDAGEKKIYHTNVMMCIGEVIAVICLESITNLVERDAVIDMLTKTNHVIVDISFEQMNHFAGNMLEVSNREGERFLVMSAQALESLTPQQIEVIQTYNNILSPSVETIETIGGGGVRCMMAEVFLEKKG